jgi:hypothetical protein
MSDTTTPNITTPNFKTQYQTNIDTINDIIETNKSLSKCDKYDFKQVFNIITQMRDIQVAKQTVPPVVPEKTLPPPPPREDVDYINKFNASMSRIYTGVDTYNSIYDNYKHLVDLDNIYVKKTKELNGYANKAYIMGLTDNRKTYYSNENIERAHFYYRILFFIYIILMLSFLIKLLWRSSPDVPMYNKIFFFVLFILLPFVASTIYYIGNVIVKYILSFFPTAQSPVK